MQLAILGAPGTGKDRFFGLLNEALQTAGMAAEIAMPAASDASFKADTIFLMGLCSTCAQDIDADRVRRQMLTRHKLSYQVLYGSSGECVVQAMNVIRSSLQDAQGRGIPKAAPSENHPESTRPWVWACDKCSDPKCEHRLLTGLLANRPALATEPLP